MHQNQDHIKILLEILLRTVFLTNPKYSLHLFIRNFKKRGKGYSKIFGLKNNIFVHFFFLKHAKCSSLDFTESCQLFEESFQLKS